MRYSYEFTSNNLTYNAGDTLLIDFANYFPYVKSIESIKFDLSPLETNDNGHDIFIRWTYDIQQLDRAVGKPHVVWSAWEQITELGIQGEFSKRIFDKIVRQTNPYVERNSDSFDLQIRLVRRGTSSGGRQLTNITIDVTDGWIPEEPAIPVISKGGCKATSCPTTNFGTGVTIACDSNLFRPYDMMGPAIKLYHEMACSVSEMFGHCVRYFKTEANLESADPILKEYSLYTVTDVKDIKILLPDNNIPDNAINFLPYDMDFGESLEVHIVREHFHRAFGDDNLPEQKDYIYFPLLDRIFEVHSSYLFRDFMADQVYYKLSLYKWQDKLNVMRENPEIDQYVDSIHTSLDEVLDAEIQKEYIEITKPQHYQTIAIGGYDHIRSHINEKLIIETKDLTNYFTVVGKYFYDLTKGMNWQDIAAQYKYLVNRGDNANTSFTMWFKPQHLSSSTNAYDTLIEGFNASENKGFQINLDYTGQSASSITVKSNAHTLKFSKNFPTLSNNDWYGLCVNHMNEFGQIAVYIWKMGYDSTMPPRGQQKTTNLQLIFSEVIDINYKEAINPTNTPFLLRAGTIYLTNIRVWNESIEEEKQPIMLNQYVVKDNDFGLIIDNAVPPIRLVREYVR